MILLEKATAEKNYATYLAEAADTEETVLAATKAGDIVLFKKEDTIEKKMHVGDSFFQLATSCDGDGGGTEYTNIVYNEDNTVTLTDKDGVVHTMSCTYENGKLTGVNYDGEAVELTYNGDVLTTVGKTVVDMRNAPITSGIEPLNHTVTFKADGESYTIVSVKDGQSVSAPVPNPTKDGLTFGGWTVGETSVTFPLKPTEDIEVNADFRTSRTEMEWNGNGEWFRNNYRTYEKVNAEKTIQGYGYYNRDGECSFIMIGNTETSLQNSNTENTRIEQYVYDGILYYCLIVRNNFEYGVKDGLVINQDSKTCYLSTDLNNGAYYTDWHNTAKVLLDHYFYKD